MFLASDSERGKQTAKALAESMGFKTLDAGGLKNARYLELLNRPQHLLRLWRRPGHGGGAGLDRQLIPPTCQPPSGAPSTAPSLFVSHGAPTYAIEPGLAGEQLHTRAWPWASPGASWWCSAALDDARGVAVTASARPPTIHDFGGFPDVLHSCNTPRPATVRWPRAPRSCCRGWACR